MQRTDSSVRSNSCRRSWIGLQLCLLGAIVTAFSTTLPWFGFNEFNGIYVFNLSDSRSAISGMLSPAVGASTFSPGTQDWGFLILALSSGLVIAALLLSLLMLSGRRASLVWSITLIAIAAALVVVAVLDAHARPPFGDSPPLRFSWGAVLGVAAGLVSLIGACISVPNQDGSKMTNQIP